MLRLFLLLLLAAPWTSCVRALEPLSDGGAGGDGRPDGARSPDGAGPIGDRLVAGEGAGQVCSGAPFERGSGSTTDPFIICSARQLGEVRNHLAASFRLEADLDLAGLSLAPLGGCPPQTAFTGFFDGNGRTISNYAHASTVPCAGLFGRLDGSAQITRLGLRGVTVSGPRRVGGLVGAFSSPDVTVSRCWVEGGAVTSSCDQDPACGDIGALVGGVGEQKSTPGGTVTDCWASATVSGPIDAGGLVGWLNGLVSNSYATGLVTKTMSDGWGIGGVVGGQYDGTVQNSFAAGPAAVEPVVGNLHTGQVVNLHASADPSVFYNSSHAVFTAIPPWDFQTVWTMSSGSLPRLR